MVALKIKPLKSYKPPAYPSIEEARLDARLLERIPRRWSARNPLATLLGTGLMIHFAGCARNETGAPVPPPPHGADFAGIEKSRNFSQAFRAIPATRVAPLLEEALANDGRGSFGCVAVSSPVFLSENEAMDLIVSELKKVGVELHDMVALDGLKIPGAPSAKNREEDPVEEAARDCAEEEGGNDFPKIKFQLRPLAEGAYTFDLGTQDKSVLVKFLQTRDFYQWENDSFANWSVSSVNLAWLATQMRETFEQRKDGAPVVIGLFFDPMGHGWRDNDGLDTRGLTPEQEQFARRQFYSTRQGEPREKLRRQVSHFIEYLKQEGIVE